MNPPRRDAGEGEQANPRRGLIQLVRETFAKAPLWLAGLFIAALGAVITQAATGWIGSLGSALSDRVTGEPAPLTVDVSPPRLDGRLYFGDPPAVLEPTPPPEKGFDARYAWARAKGGLDAHTTVVEVVIQGTSSATVSLTGLDITLVERRRDPPSGTVVQASGASAAPARYFEVDLDASPPRAEPVYMDEFSGPDDRPIDFPYKVSESDPEFFFIFASTRRCDCTWIAELRWSSRGKPGTTVIDDDGRPFRTIAGEAAALYRVADDGSLVMEDAPRRPR